MKLSTSLSSSSFCFKLIFKSTGSSHMSQFLRMDKCFFCSLVSMKLMELKFSRLRRWDSMKIQNSVLKVPLKPLKMIVPSQPSDSYRCYDRFGVYNKTFGLFFQ